MVHRGLLIEHQNVLGLFQRRTVGIEKACCPGFVPHPLIAEHGEVGRAQHFVKGALSEKQDGSVRLHRPAHRLPQLRERQRHIPKVPCRAVGRIGQEHIHAMFWQRAQALDPVHKVQRIQLWDILSQGHIHPSLMCAEHAAGDGAGLEQAEAEQHGIAHAAPYRADGVAACGDALYQHRIDGNTDENE